MNLFTKKKQTHGHKKLRVSKGESGGGIKRSIGLTDKLYYIKQIINKDLLHNTGNDVQYPIITIM